MKVYFFPGVGADASLARFHRLPGHEVEWVRWPRRETRTWAEFLEDLTGANSIEEGAVFVGISFGGMAAQMLAEAKRPRGIILVGSCRSSRAVAPHLRLLKPLVGRLPAFLFNVGLVPRPLGALYFGIREKEHVELLFEMGRRLPPRMFRCINSLALHFESRPAPGIPVFSIHGGRDRIILADSEPRDRIIPEGGHLLSMTHSDEVNRTLLEWIATLALRK